MNFGFNPVSFRAGVSQIFAARAKHKTIDNWPRIKKLATFIFCQNSHRLLAMLVPSVLLSSFQLCCLFL